MDLEILKKKISSYRGEGGRIRNVSDDLLMEILLSWEQWTGPSKGFYTSLGIDRKRMAVLIGKAKKLKREGFPNEGFKELKIIEGGTSGSLMGSGVPCQGIELMWKENQIRFSGVDSLLEFLKKAA